MTALLASVRTEEEALLAAAAGADIIDLKEPRAGALGALPLARIAAIVARLRATAMLPVSATIGDLPDGAIDETARRVLATARTGVDYVKVGLTQGPDARPTLERLAVLPAPVVPLFFADAGIDLATIAAACALAFPIVMVDTANKRTGTLFDCVPVATLRQMLQIVRGAGARAGLAGSLRLADVALLRELAPDIAGFRGALCEGGRTATLDPARVRTLRDALGPPEQRLGLSRRPAQRRPGSSPA